MSEYQEDPSGNTARFRAFTERADADSQAPWQMRAPVARVVLLAGGVVALAVIVGIIALSLAG